MPKIRKNRKALSPVIASIILIAVTVSVAVVVASWMGGLSIGLMGKAEQATITNLNYLSDSADSINVTVLNSGASSITLQSATIDGDTASLTTTGPTNSLKVDKGSFANVLVTSSGSFSSGTKYTVRISTSRGNTLLFTAEAKLEVSSGWHYYKSHVIDSQSGAGAGYQIRVVVHLGNGLDSGENVYLNGKCQSDFSDIRFAGSDGTTLLDYWIESSDGEKAVFWVRLTDNLDVSSTTIYVYYGNRYVNSLSNGINTFPTLFTDFDGNSLPDGWQVDSNTFGSMSVENSLLNLTGSAGSSGSWKYLGVKTSSPVWQNDQALMYRVDSINYYQDNNRHLWYLGGEATNYYVEFLSYGDKINVRDYNIIDYYSPANWTGGETVWLAKQSGNNGNAFYYVNGTLVDIIDGSGLHPSHQFPALTVYFKASQGASAIPSVDHAYIDWVAIRKFVYPEPVHGDWGEEVSI